jgi:isocitrate dehydrogenase kinase/phosphatase
MKETAQIAEIIIKGFRRHYLIFQEITALAKSYFESANWHAHRKSSSDRISFYDKRVKETIEYLMQHYPHLLPEESLWQQVKIEYTEYLKFHPQAELAETFYNSVFCGLFHRKYFHNKNIFVETTVNKETLPAPVSSVYESYFPAQLGLKNTLKKIIKSFNFNAPFENVNRDIRFIIKRFIKQSSHSKHALHEIRLDILKSIFYRNKAAYIVGRVVTPSGQQPFIIPLLNKKTCHDSGEPSLFADALITKKEHMIIIFGFYHAYFLVETEVPAALVRFLQELMPDKTLADLYAAIGLHKQSKTEFYRALLNHLDTSDDKFIIAPGVPGMVMSVFTLPSFPYVFKVIRDNFAPSKEFTASTVKQRYFLVKKHDRVGRMADTLEYSEVALPKDRFSKELLDELNNEIQGSLQEEDGLIIIKHLYIERRMVPMNLYLETSSDEDKQELMNDYGKAIKDMIAANIFPGDMLLKNFGITPFKRVVFYDYYEVEYLVDVNFRTIPKPRNIDDEMAAEPWYSVGPHDVFPEQFTTFITPEADLKRYFLDKHADLMDANYWREKQQQIKQGIMQDVFPYPQRIRFCNL